MNSLCPINDRSEESENMCEDISHMCDDIRRDRLNCVNAILLQHGMESLSNDKIISILFYGHKNLSLELNAKILVQP